MARGLVLRSRHDEAAEPTPTRPSELTALSDEDMFRILRKVAFANYWGFDTQVQFEATGRLIAALKDFKRSSDWSSRVLIALTIALVVLTAMIVVLTVVLVWLTLRLD